MAGPNSASKWDTNMLIDTYIVNIEWGLSTKLMVRDRWAHIAAINPLVFSVLGAALC